MLHYFQTSVSQHPENVGKAVNVMENKMPKKLKGLS